MKYKWKALKSRIRRDVVLFERQRMFHLKISMRCSSRWLKEPLMILGTLFLCGRWWFWQFLKDKSSQWIFASINLGNPKAKAVTLKNIVQFFQKWIQVNAMGLSHWDGWGPLEFFRYHRRNWTCKYLPKEKIWIAERTQLKKKTGNGRWQRCKRRFIDICHSILLFSLYYFSVLL